MMNNSQQFDLSKVLGQAQEVANIGNSNENMVKMVYPSYGTLKVKLLYNPKSGVVARQIKRHNIKSSKPACLSMYGKECPVCTAVASIKAATGADLWKLNAKSRGLSFAQYVGSENYQWEQGKEPKQGELILLMYPWTVYQDINRIINSAGPEAYKLIASNQGKVINIVRWKEGSQEKYRAEVDAFAPEFKSCNTDEEFNSFLQDIDDLNQSILPNTPDDKVINLNREIADELVREYLNPMGNPNNPQVPTGPQFAPGVNPGSFVDPTSGQQYVNNGGMIQPNQSQAQMVGGMSQGGFVPNPMSGNVPPMNPQMNPQIAPHQNTAPQMPPSMPPQSSGVPPMNPQIQIGNSAPQMAGQPECFGHREQGSQKCTCCPNEMQCALVSQ